MTVKKTFLTLLLLALTLSLYAELPTRTVEAEGLGETVEEALHNARRNAVRKAFGEVVNSTAELHNETLDESTVSASSGFIMSYEVLGEPEHLPESAVYKVKIRAVVATEKLRAHIGGFKSTAANVVTVDAEGMGKTVKQALLEARRNAARKAFGEVVDSVAELRNEKFDESTITASSGFIVSAKMIGSPEYLPGNEIYKVKIRATVSKDKIRDHINRFRTGAGKTDVSSILQSAVAADEMDKKIVAMLIDFDMEFYKTLKAVNFKYFLKDGSLVLKTDIEQDAGRFEALKSEFRRSLVAHGYVRIDSPEEPIFKKCRGGAAIGLPPEHCPRCRRASPWQRFCDRWGHYEIYCKENAIIYTTDLYDYRRQDKDPRNFLCRRGKTAIELQLVKSDGERICVGGYYDATGEFIRPDDGHLSLRHAENFINHSLSSSYEIGPGLKGVTAAEVVVIYKLSSGTRTVTIGKIPVNIENIFVQRESMNDRSDDYAKLVSSYVREFNKTVVPKADIECDRRDNNIKLKVKLTVDRNGYFSTLRKMESQLGQLGIRHNRLGERTDYRVLIYNGDPEEVEKERTRRLVSDPIRPTGRYVNGVWVQPPTPPRPPDNWPREFRIPDGDRKIGKTLYSQLKKLSYVLVVHFRDAVGNVLQTFEVPVSECMPLRGVGNSELEVGMTQWSFKVSVGLSPKDIPNIKSLEYVIEERIRE